jgi:membrane-bound ClpP family serine protease
VGVLVAKTQRRPARLGSEGLIGERGEVRKPIEPGRPGQVFVHGEYWGAAAEEPVPEGSEVEVVAVEGLRLRVRPVKTLRL